MPGKSPLRDFLRHSSVVLRLLCSESAHHACCLIKPTDSASLAYPFAPAIKRDFGVPFCFRLAPNLISKNPPSFVARSNGWSSCGVCRNECIRTPHRQLEAMVEEQAPHGVERMDLSTVRAHTFITQPTNRRFHPTGLSHPPRTAMMVCCIIFCAPGR